uniref:Uncharacterized protein n=1 Tax=Eutreptiella gymnastica TaxID=73025 RepID=A0A7S4FIH2_9EUGL
MGHTKYRFAVRGTVVSSATPRAGRALERIAGAWEIAQAAGCLSFSWGPCQFPPSTFTTGLVYWAILEHLHGQWVLLHIGCNRLQTQKYWVNRCKAPLFDGKTLW